MFIRLGNFDICVKCELEKYDCVSKSLKYADLQKCHLTTNPALILNGKDVLHTLRTTTGDNNVINNCCTLKKNKVCTLIDTNMIQVLSQNPQHDVDDAAITKHTLNMFQSGNIKPCRTC